MFKLLNLPLGELAKAGKFDPVLLEKIAHTAIKLPALRERAGDIPALTRHFLGRIGDQPGLRHLSIADSALALLDFPDQLQLLHDNLAIIERAVEELLRYGNPVEHGTIRSLTEDVTLHGVTMPKSSAALLENFSLK